MSDWLTSTVGARANRPVPVGGSSFKGTVGIEAAHAEGGPLLTPQTANGRDVGLEEVGDVDDNGVVARSLGFDVECGDDRREVVALDRFVNR